jgi:hypothetical protein
MRRKAGANRRRDFCQTSGQSTVQVPVPATKIRCSERKQGNLPAASPNRYRICVDQRQNDAKTGRIRKIPCYFPYSQFATRFEEAVGPGYRRIPKNATIQAGLGLGGEIPSQRDTAGQKEAIMGERFSGSIITAAIAGAAVSVVISVSTAPASAQAPVASATAPAAALTTTWGEPDLQGIWTD